MTALLEAPDQLAAEVIASIPADEFAALFEDGPAEVSRDEAITRIKRALDQRSGYAWTVRPCGPQGLRIVGGRGLARLLNRPEGTIEPGGQYVPGGRYRDEYLARAEGRQPTVYGGILNHPTIRALARSQGWT